MAQAVSPQRVLVTEERSGDYGRGRSREHVRVDGEKTIQDTPSTVCTLEAPNKALQDVKDKHYSTWKLDSALPRFAETAFCTWAAGGCWRPFATKARNTTTRR